MQKSLPTINYNIRDADIKLKITGESSHNINPTISSYLGQM